MSEKKSTFCLVGAGKELPELFQFDLNDSFDCNNMAGGITNTRLFDALQFYIGSEIESMQSLTCGPIYRSWSIFILLSSLIPWTPSIQGLTCNRSCNFFWQQKYTVGLNGLDKWNLWAPSTEGVEESTAGCVHTHCQPPTLRSPVQSHLQPLYYYQPLGPVSAACTSITGSWSSSPNQ